MAHAVEKRTQLRGLYVYQRLPMEAACKKLGVPRTTASSVGSSKVTAGSRGVAATYAVRPPWSVPSAASRRPWWVSVVSPAQAAAISMVTTIISNPPSHRTPRTATR